MLDDPTPNLDECRLLILKMIEQAIRDFLNLEHSSAPIEQEYYHTACAFLFDDNYHIDYGGIDRNLRDLLDILSIDVHWFRERIVRVKNKRVWQVQQRRMYYDEDEED